MKSLAILFLLLCPNLLAQKVTRPEQIANPIQLPKIENVSCSDCQSLEFFLVDSVGGENLWRRIEYLENGKPKMEIVRHQDSNSFDAVKFNYDKSEREILREIVDTLGNVVLRYETLYDFHFPSARGGTTFTFVVKKEDTEFFEKYAEEYQEYYTQFPFKYAWGAFLYKKKKLQGFSKLGFYHKCRYDSENRLKKISLISKRKEEIKYYYYANHGKLEKYDFITVDLSDLENVKQNKLTTHYQYDKLQRLISIQTGDTTTTFQHNGKSAYPNKVIRHVFSQQIYEGSYEFDEQGNLLSEIKKTGSDNYSFKFYEYENGRIVKFQGFESNSPNPPKVEERIKVIYNFP